MYPNKLFLLIIFVYTGLSLFAQDRQPVDYADPLLGTFESRWMLNPGATLPFGMVQLSPDNQAQGGKAGYEYTLGSIFGFSHVHAWIMSGLSVMPAKGILQPGIYPNADAPISTGRRTSGHRSRIDKNSEEASPGYYKADLVDFDIRAEVTSTTRCGFFALLSLKPKMHMYTLICNFHRNMKAK